MTFDQLVAAHNPKDDHGAQYRSSVFYTSPDQKAAADAWKEALEERRGPVVTTIEAATEFWPAEEYHQRYLEKGGQSAGKGSAEPMKCYG